MPSVRTALSSRQGMLTMAVLSALAAAAVIAVALSHYRRAVVAGTQQETVLTATGVIEKGESANAIAAARLYKALPVLASHVQAGAITNAAALQGEVATQQILPGAQLTAADFATSGDLAAQLGRGDRAVAVTLDQAHGLSSVVQTGDHVAVYGSFASNGAALVSLLIPDAVVLHSSTSGGSNQDTYVLDVTAQQAPQLAYADDNGKVWLALRPPIATAASTGLTTLSTIAPTLASQPTSTQTTTTTGGAR